MPVTWLQLDLVRVPARPQGFWTLAQEYVPGGRLLRITGLYQDAEKKPLPKTWSPTAGLQCGPDGMIPNPARGNLICASALLGTLIGKLGGSTADLPDSTLGATPYGTKKVFAVGSELILPLGTGDGGPLFLTMNDNTEGFAAHSGELFVSLQHYPV